MTNKEIIKGLDDVKEQLNKLLIHRHSWMYQPIDEAIKVLSAESCDDCISRKSAILGVQRYGVGCFDADDFIPEQAERFVISMLNDLPPVTPKTEVLDKIRTEKEIIKPYLEKLYESIINRKWGDSNDDFMAGVAVVSNMIYDIIEMMGK